MKAVLMLAAACLIGSAVLTGITRRAALAGGLLDLPNERSSHTAATPRGGGLAIVISSLVGFLILRALGALDDRTLLALLGGLPIAVVGLLDDRRPVRVPVRLTVHFCAAIWALIWLGGLPPLPLGDSVVSFGAGGYVLGVLCIVWVLNLFNFMDGIDGIAATEGVFVSWAGAILAGGAISLEASSAAAFVLGASCVGFLLWNWPPARIFMGDVGSGYLGYALAVIALASAHQGGLGLLPWWILGGAFFVDATLTLLVRLTRGERLHQAHRTHAYQRLARRWGSHRSATLAFLAVNVLWLLPMAVLADQHPPLSGWLTLAALVPLVGVAMAIGAGRREGAAAEH